MHMALGKCVANHVFNPSGSVLAIGFPISLIRRKSEQAFKGSKASKVDKQLPLKSIQLNIGKNSRPKEKATKSRPRIYEQQIFDEDKIEQCVKIEYTVPCPKST